MKKIPIKKLENKEMEMIEGPGSYPPSFYINDKQMPEIRNLKVGEKYTICFEVEMKSFRDESIADKPQKINASASFDILAYEIEDEDMSDEDLEKMQGKALAN